MHGKTAKPKPNWKNRTLYHGDNLDFVRSMNSATVDLIATDPPFNKGRDFHATPESLAAGGSFQDRWRWEQDVHAEWVEQMQDDWPGVWAVIDWTRMVHSDAMAAFLCFMGVRLVAMHRILRDEGSIYLHCDTTAGAYLKTLMDAVFGREGFRNCITWRRAIAHNDARQWGRITDSILFYTKSTHWTWNRVLEAPDEAELAKLFPKKDSEGRRYRSDNLTGAEAGQGESSKAWKGYDIAGRNRHWAPPLKGDYAEYIERHWIPGYRSIQGVHARLDALDASGLIEHPTRGFWPGLVRYAEGSKGKPQQDLIYQPTGLTNYNTSETTGYPTQKPLALYRKLIRTSSNEGEVVFDPFAGCATTPVAAELEGRQWVACDIWEGAHETVLKRLAKEVGVGEDDQRRLIDHRDVHLRREPLVRTEDGKTAAPTLRTLTRKTPPPSMKREQMVATLVAEHGIACQGCGRTFDSARYLELDHRIPRSEGGSNEVENRVLLCGPCNRTKGSTLTLTGLRKENRRAGFMAGQDVEAKPRRRASGSAGR